MESKYTDILIPILMKRLYEYNGELPLRNAIHFIRANSPREVLNTDEDIKHWLDLNSSYFKLQHDRIVGITEARLCTKHCSEPGSCRGGCDKLHICRYFILTKEFKCHQRECRFNHDLRILHNSYILQKYKLQFLNEEELRRLFRKTENRSQQTLPIICRNFNIGICEKRNCRFLHICKQFILGKCLSGRRCSVSHLIDDKIRAIFHSYAIDFKNVPNGLHELKLMYSADRGLLPNNGLFKGISTSDVSVDHNQENYLEKAQRLYSSHMDLPSLGSHKKTRVKKNVNTNKSGGICMKFLFNNCSSECRYHHKQSPYQWQYKIYSENDWKDFDDPTNEKLEEKYCHLTDEIHIPSKNGFMRYNFEKMEFSSSKTEGKLRRLSTASSVHYPNNKWNTVWVWYWKNDDECWMKYDANNSESPALSSEEIEGKYLANKTGQMHFIYEGTVCFIDFKEMFQMNGEKRAVLRRPMFFEEKNIEENAVNLKSHRIKREVEKKPRNKHKRKVQENNNSELMTDFEIIELEQTDSDFEETAKKFNETMMARGAKIMSIEIIKNRDLLEEYERRKNKMTEKLVSVSIVNEMDLFHGTESANISIISKQGFDARLSGGNSGSRFGNGCYFTKKADYAHGYVTPENNLYKMFLVKVLVGYSCKGKMSYVRPPLIDPSNEGGDFYNSCVDDVENPNVFVIFTNDQMYPAYIITYTF